MTWTIYAIPSACFGALVAIFAKIDVVDVDSNLAVAVRTVIIVFFAWGIVALQGNVADSSASLGTLSSFLFFRPSPRVFPGFSTTKRYS